jgi:hypothetical protein
MEILTSFSAITEAYCWITIHLYLTELNSITLFVNAIVNELIENISQSSAQFLARKSLSSLCVCSQFIFGKPVE